jgi:hypothetical protein
MNPISEEAGKTARGVVDAFKQQPAMLLLFLINLLFIVLVFSTMKTQSERKDDRIDTLIKLVASCPSGLTVPKE